MPQVPREASDRLRLPSVLPPPHLLACTVVVGSVHLPCQFEHRDYVQTLVKLAQVHFVNEHNGDVSRLVGLRNRRTNRDLYYFSAAGDEILNGDILEGRPYTAAPPTVSEKAMLLASTSNRQFKSQIGRPGIFAVTLLHAEGFEFPKPLIVSAQLDPYDTVIETEPSDVQKWNSVMQFKHPDASTIHLFLELTVRSQDNLVLGHVRVPMNRGILTPGIQIDEWISFDHVSTQPSLRRICIRHCFHPTVYKVIEPTDHSPTKTSAAKIFNSAVLAVSNSCKRGSMKLPKKKNILPPPSEVEVKPQPVAIRGNLSLFVKGLHVCGPQCSKLDGHSTLYSPDFEPIVAIGFESMRKEIHVHATECHAVVYKKKLEVHSAYSEIQIDLLKPMTIAASPNATRLKSGKQAVRYGSLSISMMELQQRQGASWTVSPTVPTPGPGKKPPETGFDWYVLRQSDEEVGLVQVQAIYKENFLSFLDTTLHGDATYVRADELDFNADLIKRNIERLDAIISAIKGVKFIIHELLEWKNPAMTVVSWMGLTLGIWYFPASHAPVVFIVGLLLLLVVNFYHFVRGDIERKWTYFDPDEIKMKMFRSIATLRVAPIVAENLLEQQFFDPKCKDGARPLDSYVRIFYEPMFKDLPLRLIAQTETVSNSRNPQYGKGKDPTSGKQTSEVLNLNNKWFRDMFLHLSPLAKDAVLHDVVEAWKRHDGGVDVQAFKYPLLQPVRTNPITELEDVMEWDAAPGMIRFDVMQDNPLTSSQNLLGRVRLPLNALVTSARLGGTQIEFEKTFPLEESPLDGWEDDELLLGKKPPTLTIRAQLILRDTSKRVTWKERLASEAMYSVLEMENAKSLSLVEKYHMARNVARTIQHELGKLADLLEKIKNFLLWTHPQKTALAFLGLCFAAIVTTFVPVKYFILFSITKKFTNRFHRMCDFRLIDRDIIRALNFFSSFPTDIEEQKIFRHANQAFLREKEHTTAQAKLQADWAGYIYKRGEGVFVGWAHRYAAVRNGKLEYWSTISDAKHGIPPKGHVLLSSSIDKCTKAEVANAPKDTFPFVVFNIDHKHLLTSPEGRRRIIAVMSEQDYQDIVRAIQESG